MMNTEDVVISCVMSFVGVVTLLAGIAMAYVWAEASRSGGYTEKDHGRYTILALFWGIVLTAWGTSPLWMR